MASLSGRGVGEEDRYQCRHLPKALRLAVLSPRRLDDQVEAESKRKGNHRSGRCYRADEGGTVAAGCDVTMGLTASVRHRQLSSLPDPEAIPI